MNVSRPVLRYFGGKWRLAPWIISHFPDHKLYVEPFGGAASVLLRKKRSFGEIYNDLDDAVVNVFRVLRDPAQSSELIDRLKLTPFSRAEFIAARTPCDDPVSRAWGYIVRSFMGFGAVPEVRGGTGFRANSWSSRTPAALDWSSLGDAYPSVVDRLKGVVIESLPAIDVIEKYDAADTLFYLDPPYVHETRSDAKKQSYREELTDHDHQRLIEFARGLDGLVVLSGYRSELYDDLLVGWRRVDREFTGNYQRKHTESLWLNASCQEALASFGLFACEGAA